MGVKCKLSRISWCVLVVVLVMWQLTWGILFFTSGSNEKYLSAAVLGWISNSSKMILLLSTLAGVPVFKRYVLIPISCKFWVRPCAACSPDLPADIDLFPIHILPSKNVPAVMITDLAE